MAKLVLHVPGGGMRDILLDRDRLTIGRRADNDVCLPYPAVSAEHAAVITVLEDSFLEDLQSTNGTLVNGTRISKHFLRDHDAIDLGRVQLVYLVDVEERVAPLVSESTVGPPAEKASAPMPIASAPTSVEEHIEIEDGDEADDRARAPVDDLLDDMMDSNTDTAVAVDIPPTISVVPTPRRGSSHIDPRSDATSGVYVEVMNGPNAGQIAPMTRREFVLGQGGATKAVIRRDGDRFSLVPIDAKTMTRLNGAHVPAEGASLAFGDTIDVAGVMLRFGRRPPL
jgi:predicted component of type VI protein secretion system